MHIYRFTNPNNLDTFTDWFSIGAAIGVKANIMSWVLNKRDSMQHKIKLGERTVFRSDPALRFVQSRMNTLLVPLFEKLPDTDHVIAYRKGITATDVVRNVPHAKTFISFDVRHYYDNITLPMIEQSLSQLGLPRLGARLIGRYCIVKKGQRHTLQQGSPTSPVISNIVGHFLLDKPVLAWLENSGVKVTYLRYCDNVAFFVHEDCPDDFPKLLKDFVKETYKKTGFKTHKWATVADNHPVMHQKFLGMVINAEARAELDVFNRLRAMLFNACRFGFPIEAEKYLAIRGIRIPRHINAKELCTDKYVQHLRGHVQYIKRLNRKQGLMLEKLYKAAEFFSENDLLVKVCNNYISAVKQYRNSMESVDDYVKRVQNSIH